jgi:hypothetical protein
MNDDKHISLEPHAVLREQAFQSSVPLVGGWIARFRTAWNSISTRWYILPLLRQQSEFNLMLLGELRETQTNLGAAEAAITELQHRQDGSQRLQSDLELRLEDCQALLIDADRERVQLRQDLAELTIRLQQVGRADPESSQRPGSLDCNVQQ